MQAIISALDEQLGRGFGPNYLRASAAARIRINALRRWTPPKQPKHPGLAPRRSNGSWITDSSAAATQGKLAAGLSLFPCSNVLEALDRIHTPDGNEAMPLIHTDVSSLHSLCSLQRRNG